MQVILYCYTCMPMPRTNGVFFMAANADRKHMLMALDLAEKGRGRSFPNPMVGAVILKAGRVVGEGYHHAAGKPHAEIEAIKSAGNKTKGATLYVTLEPCCHTGRTGPCTEAIIKAGIKRVIFAVKDPDQRVSGKGSRFLAKHGVEVLSGICRKEATIQNDAYFGSYKLNRPYITLKIAQTIDGRIATANGDSKWITSPAARKAGHLLRAQADGIIVGANTVRTDNPSLTVRHVSGNNPYRIIVSTNGKLSVKSNLFSNNEDGRTILATSGNNTSNKTNKIIWNLKSANNGMIDISDLVSQARKFGLRSLLIEGGAQLATSFLKAKLVDKIVFFVAPKIIGNGKSSIADLGISKIANAIDLKNFTHELVGQDSMFTGYPDWSKN